MVPLHFPTLTKALAIAAQEVVVDYVVERCGGSHRRTAAALGIDPGQLRRLLRKFRANALLRAAARTRVRGPGIKKAVPRAARRAA